MGERREKRLITILKIVTWKFKNDYIKNSNRLIKSHYIKDFKKSLLKILEDKLKIIYSKTQLEYFHNETSTVRAEYTMSQILKAVTWEIAVSPELAKFLKNIKYESGNCLRREDIVDMHRSIATALGLKYNPNMFDGEKQVKYYRLEIVKELETTEDRLTCELDEIKKICEYDSVLGAIRNCKYVVELPKYDRKKNNRNKIKFEKEKLQAINFLKSHRQPYDNIEKLQYKNNKDDEWVYYNGTLKHIKEVLYNELTLICGTGKDRANKIAKILEYI